MEDEHPEPEIRMTRAEVIALVEAAVEKAITRTGRSGTDETGKQFNTLS